MKPFTIKVILNLDTGRGWDNQQININNVLLNVELQELVYKEQHKGFVDKRLDYVCCSHEASYGLKHTPRPLTISKRHCCNRDLSILHQIEACFSYKSTSKVVPLLVHVDDSLIIEYD